MSTQPISSSTQVPYSRIAKDGLWVNNPALVQLLGLCPLLAVTNSVVNAIGLGIVTTLVMVATNALVSMSRYHISSAVRLPAFVMVIATLVTVAELLMQAYAYELYQILGIFIPLIVTNCAILGRVEAFACKQPLGAAAFDGLCMGLGFTLVLVVLGGLRELLGTGVVLANMNLLFGAGAETWAWHIIDDYQGFLLALLPPGAFIIMGCLIAVKNSLDSYLKDRLHNQVKLNSSRRVRVTGSIT